MTNDTQFKPILPYRQFLQYGTVFAHNRLRDPEAAAGQKHPSGKTATETHDK